MKIVIDIGHPAHVHYFKNFIKIMQKQGHICCVSARNRSIIHYLLDYYSIVYFDRGQGKNSAVGKLFYMIYADLILLFKSLKFKPDLYLSFASPYAAQVSWILRKPHIVLDDTEHAIFGQMLYRPFSSVLLNPSCFYKNFGRKQILFNSFMEFFYLHPDYYVPNEKIFSFLGINPHIKYIILRFVTWQANHDVGHSGLDRNSVYELISTLEQKYKVYISSEGRLFDDRLSKYLIKIPPEFMHDALYYADLVITEGGTMASEAAILNTPVIYVNSIPLMGYLIDEQKHGLLFHYRNSRGVKDKVDELMKLPDIKATFKPMNARLLQNAINPTTFLVWFIESYPESVRIMKNNPNYQNYFK